MAAHQSTSFQIVKIPEVLDCWIGPQWLVILTGVACGGKAGGSILLDDRYAHMPSQRPTPLLLPPR